MALKETLALTKRSLMIDTKLIRVFVSCPGDLATEKEAIKKICESRNHNLSSKNQGITFEVLDFKDIVESWGERPQHNINVRFSGYDIYLGLLWMRYGSSSGASDPKTGKPFESGTEEEFRIAKAKFEEGVPIEIYFFFKDPKAPSGLAEGRQFVKVQEFKEEIQSTGWVHTFPNTLDMTDFNNKIHSILNDWIWKVEQGVLVAEKEEFIEEIKALPKSAKTIDLISFIASAQVQENIIYRTASAFDPRGEETMSIFGSNTGESLLEIVKTHTRIVLLGSAGSGKSTELANLAVACSVEESPFVPVFQRMNTYVDEDIADFLPKNWNDIPENICLIILDGLDEIQPSHFNNAAKKLISFSQKHPQLRIVVSCRTNFYDFPSTGSSGTLSNFEVYMINDLQIGNIPEYANLEFGIKGTEFIKEAYDKGYKDLLGQPFFLKLLLEAYRLNGNLEINRVQLLDQFIQSRFDFDQQHFKLTTNLKSKKHHIIGLLKRVALVMEYMGKNYVTSQQLEKILENPEDVELLRFSTAFNNLESDPNYWGFEHNNIQEFLAASSLTEMPIDQIKKAISFNLVRIKPSWANTVFFLMGIIEEEKRKRLIEWILEIEPDILVRIESININESTRLDIFKNIFEHHKTKGIWLRSNKFTNRELARFAPSKPASAYLLEQLSDNKNTRHVRLNALDLLQYQQLDDSDSKNVREKILEFISETLEDPHAFYSAASALAKLGQADHTLIEMLMKDFGDRKNQYVRSGLYHLIIKAGLENEYIDYLLNGIGISDKEPDREQVNLMDESMQLREALSAKLEIEPLKKIISLFSQPDNRKLFRYSDRHDVFRNIVDRAIELFPDHPELYELLYDTYRRYARVSEEAVSKIVSEFFKATNTSLELFKQVFDHSELGSYEKSLLYKNVLDKAAIDFVIGEYLGHNLTKKQLQSFYDESKWFARQQDEETVNYLEEQVRENSDILANKVEVDIIQVRNDYELRNLALYFSPEDIKKEVSEFFSRNKIEQLDWDTLFSFKNYDYRDEKEIKDAAFDLLVDLTRKQEPSTLARVLAYIDQPERFENYLFTKLKDKLSSFPELTLSGDQQNKLENWVRDRTEKADIEHAITIYDDGQNRIGFNPQVQTLWYYISRYNIKISIEKILDFTTYDDLKRNADNSLDFGIIEAQAGRENVQQRVVANLTKGIPYDTSWKNNAVYALDNKLKAAFPKILDGIADSKRSEYARNQVLKTYDSEIGDNTALLKLLDKVGVDNIRLNIFQLLFKKDIEKTRLKTFLLSILNSQSEAETEKFIASKYLTRLGEKNGTGYYLDYMISQWDEGNLDYYYDASSLGSITDPVYLPKLMQLLWIAKTEKQKDEFNRLEPTVAEGLTNIGLSSEDNLKKVRLAIEDFITENTGKIEHVNFLYPYIERMEYQYYLAQSQKGDLAGAIAEINRILPKQ
jgi:hypothetical protein